MCRNFSAAEIASAVYETDLMPTALTSYLWNIDASFILFDLYMQDAKYVHYVPKS